MQKTKCGPAARPKSLYFLDHFFLVCNSGLLFFDQPFLNAFQLGADGVKVVVVVLDTVDNFLIYFLFAFIHTQMVVSPLFSEYFSLLVNLPMKVISQVL